MVAARQADQTTIPDRTISCCNAGLLAYDKGSQPLELSLMPEVKGNGEVKYWFCTDGTESLQVSEPNSPNNG